jgi:tetratricopeptide (TPR) repeat protein
MAAPLSWAKKLIFGCALAAVLLAAILAAIEGGLRLSGYGHPTGFWREVEDKNGQTWIRENWWVTVPFFSPELVRRPQAFRLPAKKAPESYRIFVLGSSAAMGDPEPSFSIARVLEVMLASAYPELRFEVVNAGVTAINSHVVRGIAVDCAKLQPDMFFVYEGNNEVIGPFGPGTVFTASLQSEAAIRASIFLRSLRLGQWISSAARRTRDQHELKQWGGMEMFMRHQIPADDPRLANTAELFRQNLRAIAEAGRDAGAIVVFSTVLTNQKDFAPFQAAHRQGLSPGDRKAFEQSFQSALAAARAGQWEEVERLLRAIIQIDDMHAEAHFILGRVLLRRGQIDAARESFQRALDLDVLRFRTDSRLNQVIRSVAGEGRDGVVLADVVKAGEAESANSILGDELLYEHVHLSFRGTHLVARELFARVSDDLVKRGRLKADQRVTQPLSLEEARQRLAFTTYDQAMIVKELLARQKRPPFTQQSNNAERVAALHQRDARASQLLSLSQSGEAMRTIYEQAIAQRPDDWILRRNYGMAMAALNRAELAKPALIAVRDVIPDDPDTLYSLAFACRQLGESAEADKCTEELKRVAPRYLEGAAK